MSLARNFIRCIPSRSICTSNQLFVPVPLTYTSYSSPEIDKNPPVVIVHGLFGQKTNWNSVGKALHRKLEAPVFAVDVRNHGSSPHVATMSYSEMAEDLVEFIDKVREETQKPRVNLLGHSMGGKIVMRMAIDSKWCDRIEKLIVEDASPKGYKGKKAEFRGIVAGMRQLDLRKTRRELLVDLEPAIPDLSIRHFILTNLQPSERHPGSMEWKCNLDALESYVENSLESALPNGRFDGPTLFILGGRSGYVPDSLRPEIRSLFPQAEFDTIPDAGHWAHAEKPQLFVESVCKFLNE